MPSFGHGECCAASSDLIGALLLADLARAQ
jgi:hypothetical protein